MKWNDDRDVGIFPDENSPSERSRTSLELEDRRVTTVMALLPGVFASLAPNVQGVDITPQGEVLATTTDKGAVQSHEPYCPSITEYGLSSRQPRLPVLPRSKLTVLKRMSMGVDQVSYIDPQSGQERVAALKFPFRNPSYVGGGLWTDIHVLGRLPPHPNIVSMNALVVEEISGLGVVGYTMPFFDGYTPAHQPAPGGLVFQAQVAP